MINFQYARANDVADAVRQIAADPTAKFIAGGTNLIDLMKENVERPSRLIDISRLPLKSVEETADGGLRIGALVPNSDLAYHPLIEQRYPLAELIEALRDYHRVTGRRVTLAWTLLSGINTSPADARQLAALTRERGEENTAVRFEEDGQLAERYAALIQEHVLGAGPPGGKADGGAEETNVPVPPAAAG